MSSIKVADIRGFFGGQKAVATVATSKPTGKKEKVAEAGPEPLKEATDEPQEAVAGSKRPRANTPERTKNEHTSTPTRGSSAKRSKGEAAAAVEAAPSSSARRRKAAAPEAEPSKSTVSPAKTATKHDKHATNDKHAPRRSAAIAADSDEEDDIAPIARRASGVRASALFSTETSDSDDDIRISDVKAKKAAAETKKAHDVEPKIVKAATPERVEPAKRLPDPVPAPVVLQSNLHAKAADISAADFFGSSVVVAGKGSTAAASEAGAEVEGEAEGGKAPPAKRQRKAEKTTPSRKGKQTAPSSANRDTAVTVVDDFDDIDLTLLDAIDVDLTAGDRAPALPAVAPNTAAATTTAAAKTPSTSTSIKQPAAASPAPKAEKPTVPVEKKPATPAPAPLEPITGLRAPTASADALKGTKWVLTGELENMTRESAIDTIRKCGGEVVSAISGKVDHLLIGGLLEDGRPVTSGSKYQKAIQMNEEKKGKTIKIVTEGEFFEMLESSLPPSQRPVKKAAPQPMVVLPSREQSSTGSGSGHDLWVERYKPQSFTELVGNRRELESLDNWLKNWDAIHLHRTMPAPKFSMQSNAGAKAVLISGPPGIGKSSTAALLAKRYGYDVLEMNASDARSKRILQEGLEGVTDNTSVASFFTRGGSAGSSDAKPLRRLIIMDEVDGMSGGDRGGNAELCKIIRETKTPIVCICNDRMKSSVRTLVRYCYDIKFHAPSVDQIAARMAQIAKAEEVQIDTGALNALIESCGGDLRQCLNALQMWSITAKTINKSQMDSRINSVSKDTILRLDAFSATPKIFSETKTRNLDGRMELFYVDYDMIPLLVQQAYPGVIEKTTGPDMAKLMKCVKASEAISDGDIYTDYVRSRQAWGLLPSVGVANVRAAGWASGPPPYLMFPTILGKMSSRTKRARLLAEMGLHMSSHVSGGREAIRLDYLEPLREALFSPLLADSAKSDAAHAAEISIALLDSYGLSKDDMMVTMGEEIAFQGDSSFKEYFKLVDSKVKSAFTLKYNKGSHRAQSLGGLPPGMVSAMKGGRRGGGGASLSIGVDEDGMAEEDDELVADEDLKELEKDDEEENSDSEKAAAAFRAKKSKAKPKAASTRGRGGAGGGAGKGAGRGGAAVSGRKRKAADLSDDSVSDSE